MEYRKFFLNAEADFAVFQQFYIFGIGYHCDTRVASIKINFWHKIYNFYYYLSSNLSVYRYVATI